MRRFFTIVFLLTTSMSFARMSFTAEIGANASRYILRKEGSFQPVPRVLPGVLAGAHIDVPLNKIVSVETGAYYVQEGLKFFYPAYDFNGAHIGDVHQTTRLHCLRAPLNAVLWSSWGSGKIYFTAGPYITLLLSGSMKIGVPGAGLFASGDDTTMKVAIGGNSGATFRRTDIGANAGVGYRTASGLTFCLTFLKGLVNMAQPLAGFNPPCKSMNVSATAGWTFAARKRNTEAKQQ